MNIFLRILLGLGIAAVGVFFTVRTRTVVEFFGRVDYFDQKLGGGGTNLFYKFLGILGSLIGFLVATNLWDAFLEATLGGIFPQG